MIFSKWWFLVTTVLALSGSFAANFSAFVEEEGLLADGPDQTALDSRASDTPTSLYTAASLDQRAVITELLMENPAFIQAFDTEQLQELFISVILKSIQLHSFSLSPDQCSLEDVIKCYKVLDLFDHGRLNACFFEFLTLQPDFVACRSLFLKDAMQQSWNVNSVQLWKAIGRFYKCERAGIMSHLRIVDVRALHAYGWYAFYARYRILLHQNFVFASILYYRAYFGYFAMPLSSWPLFLVEYLVCLFFIPIIFYEFYWY